MNKHSNVKTDRYTLTWILIEQENEMFYRYTSELKHTKFLT